MFSVEHNNVYYSISGNKFQSHQPSSGHRYINLKDWSHVVYTDFKSYGIPFTPVSKSVNTTLSFVACDILRMFVESCNKIKIFNWHNNIALSYAVLK